MNLGSHKLILILLFCFASMSLKAKPLEGSLVQFQFLDKITAKVSNLDIKVNESMNFESLFIEVFACYKTPPEEIPENYVLLKIYDILDSAKKDLLYQGWMISSSPAVTPLEHPIYDLWLKECKIETDF